MTTDSRMTRRGALASFGAAALLVAPTATDAGVATLALTADGNPSSPGGKLLELAAAGTGTDGVSLTGAPDEVVDRLGLTYIKDLASHAPNLRKFRTTFADPANWSQVLQAAADSGEPTILVPGNVRVDFRDQWTIHADGQKWVGEGMDNSSLLYRTSVVDEAAVVVTGEGNGMRHLGVKCPSFDGLSKQNIGVHVVRLDGSLADQDFEFRDGYLSGFWYGIQNRGRGLSVLNSLISVCRYGVNFDWPADGAYREGGNDAMKKTTGFRRLRVSGCEFHSLKVAGVRNRGQNALNAHLVIEGNYSNFGDGIFQGYLGNGSVLRGNTVTHANSIAFVLDGGSNYALLDNVVCGDRSLDKAVEPESFLLMQGDHQDFFIDGFKGTYCRKNGISMKDGTFVGVVRNVDLVEIGSSGAGFDGVFVQSAGPASEILADGVSLRNRSACRSVVDMLTAGSVLKHRGVVPLGGVPTSVSGFGTFMAV